MVVVALLEIRVPTDSQGHSTDSWHRSMDPQHLTCSLVAIPGRSADLTTEAWPAAFPHADDQASVEGSMVAGVSTVVEVFTGAEAAGNLKFFITMGNCRLGETNYEWGKYQIRLWAAAR